MRVVPIFATEDGDPVTLDLAELAWDAEDGTNLVFSLPDGVEGGQAVIEGSLLVFDPAEDFQDLAQGEELELPLDVTATDSSGNSVTAPVTVTVIGSNDAPMTTDAAISLAQGATFAGQVAASDIDGDSLEFVVAEGPEGGSLTLDPETGAFAYTAAEGFAGLDRFTVAVSDPSGARAESEIVVAVGDDSLDTDAGQQLSMALDGEGLLRIEATPPLPEPTGVNVVLVLDSSQSVGEEAFAAATQVLADAATALATVYEGTGIPVEMHLVTYAAVVNQSGPYDLVSDLEALRSDLLGLEIIGPGTRWDEALSTTSAIFDAQPEGESNTVIFVSDGAPTRDFSDELARLTDEDTNGYAVDIAAFATDESSEMSLLDVIDSGGEARVLSAAEDVVMAVPSAPDPGAVLVGFELELVADGVSQGVVADFDDLVETEAGMALDLSKQAELLGLLGDSNTFLGSAIFDLDGDTAATDDTATLVLHATLDGVALSGTWDGEEGEDAFLPLPDASLAVAMDLEDGRVRPLPFRWRTSWTRAGARRC